jgi:hypothetical protein
MVSRQNNRRASNRLVEQEIAMSDDITKLTELIGAYGVQCSETKELAPSKELTDALAAVRKESSGLAANQCLHGIHGDEGGTPYCPRIRQLELCLKTASRALREWQDRYGEWSVMMQDRMGSRLPPASHIEALELIEASLRDGHE